MGVREALTAGSSREASWPGGDNLSLWRVLPRESARPTWQSSNRSPRNPEVDASVSPTGRNPGHVTIMSRERSAEPASRAHAAGEHLPSVTLVEVRL